MVSEIKTDVDRLLTLVKDKKEISVDEAAKELGMSAKSVESLSDLLEEEGMLHVKYKFTTPYLTSEMPMSREKKAAKKEEAELIIEKEAEALKAPKPGEKKAEITPAEPSKILPGMPLPKIIPEPLKEKGEIGLPETDDIDELIKRANELIAQGDFEGARQIYLKIKRIKSELPTIFIQKEKKVEGGLVDINENIIAGIDKALSTDFSKKITEISSLFGKANAKIELNKIKTLKELSEIEDIYRSIKEIYLSLPSGFMEKKVAIQDKMLELYRTILLNKKTLLTDDFKSKSDTIIQLMNQLAVKINEKNIREANSIFHQITSLYKSLPRGFLKEKTDLQNRILSIYQNLILSKEDIFTKDIKSKEEEIKGLVLQAINLVSMNQLKRANGIYKRITDIYSSLPDGFYDIRAELEVKMLDLHHLITLKQSKASLDEMNAKVQEMDTLFETANNYLKSREHDLAKESYKEIVGVYNSFPEGFIETNIRLRERIIKLYRDLLSHETMPLIGEADHDTVKIYTELLKLLVQIHECIKKKQFDKIKDKYLVAYKLYHELPLSFLEKKTSLYSEIFKIYEELKLYTEVARISEYANNNEYDKMKDMLNVVIDRYGKLINRYPEDIEIFRYVHSKILVYFDILKGRRAETGAAVRDKIGDASALKKSTEIEKTPELKEHEEKQKRSIDKTTAVMPGIHPMGSQHEEAGDVKSQGIVSAREYLKKKYNIQE